MPGQIDTATERATEFGKLCRTPSVRCWYDTQTLALGLVLGLGLGAPAMSGTPATAGVFANGLGKRFGELWALRNLDLAVEPGTVLGLLGHNGAGKTTAIRILTTLSQPTEGTASVAGLDVVAHAAEVRQRIGVAAQQATVDGLMSARLNLQTIGRLGGMS